MLKLEYIDHIGIRISDKTASVNFYELLGFKLVADGGFENGHPLVMLHSSGININLLGPANIGEKANILMDDDTKKYPGITHVALKVLNADETESFITKHDIPISGRRVFSGVKTIFIRDPDRNVIELVGEGKPVAQLIQEFVNT